MGQVASEINPAAAVANGVKAECNFCGRWAFGFQTFETHESDSDSSLEPCCGG